MSQLQPVEPENRTKQRCLCESMECPEHRLGCLVFTEFRTKQFGPTCRQCQKNYAEAGYPLTEV